MTKMMHFSISEEELETMARIIYDYHLMTDDHTAKRLAMKTLYRLDRQVNISYKDWQKAQENSKWANRYEGMLRQKIGMVARDLVTKHTKEELKMMTDERLETELIKRLKDEYKERYEEFKGTHVFKEYIHDVGREIRSKLPYAYTKWITNTKGPLSSINEKEALRHWG